MSRYLGNTSPTKREVHDTLNAKANCQLSEILPEHRRLFNTLDEAHRAGLDNCHWCLGKSTR